VIRTDKAGGPRVSEDRLSEGCAAQNLRARQTQESVGYSICQG
jgi:hypothetical protein